MSFEVSVIIPVFNAAAYVRQAVESAVCLQQVAEVLLINDFGPDQSWSVCKTLAEEFHKVRLLEHPDRANHGAGASRNLGIQAASSEFVAFLDADDWYLANRFETDQRIFESDPSIDGVYNAVGNFYESDALRELWLSQGYPDILTLSGPVPPAELPLVLLHRHKSVHGDFQTNAITVRRRIFEKVGLFHTALRLRQDTHMWHRLSVAGRLASGNLEIPVAIHRVHPQNRMTKAEDHEAYLDTWFQSLWVELRRLNASGEVMNGLRLAWCLHDKHKGRTWSATGKFLRWTMNAPDEFLKAYGEFDWLFRRLLGSSQRVDRLLSVKNRLARWFTPLHGLPRLDKERHR